MKTRSMNLRLNIILPEETVRVLDRVAARGNRSRLIDEAILHYLHSRSRKNLRERLREGYLANATDNLKLAQEWFPLEEDAWQRANKKRTPK